MRVVPVILAAGASRRLGFPKALAKFGEKTALDIAAENCRSLGRPVVVLGANASRIRPHVPKHCRIVVNRSWRRGQLSSLLAGLKKIRPSDAFMLYPVDYPLLTAAIVASLARVRLGGRKTIAVPSFRRRGGHPVIFAPAIRSELEHAKTAREVVYRNFKRIRFVTIRSEAIWRDIDTPAAYRQRVKDYSSGSSRTH